MSTATWRNSLAARLTEGPNVLTIGFADNGLLHVHFDGSGYKVRQVCTFNWFVDRLLGEGKVSAGLAGDSHAA